MSSLPPRRACLDEIKPYIPGKPVEEVERELGLKNVVKLASNENPLGPSPRAVEAVRRALPRVHLYPDGNCFYLKRALAERLGVAEEQIILGNGSDELLKLIAETYLSPGDEAVIPYPSFSEYEFSVRLMGGIPCFVPLAGFRPDLGAMAEAVGEDTRLVFICNPNNPTGTIVRRRAVAEFLDCLPPGVIAVFDEAYGEYVTDPEYPDTVEYVREERPVIALRTFSKIHGLAGLRVGYGLAPAAMVSDLGRVREPFNVNLLAQTAALAALDDEAHLARSRQVNEAGKRQLYEGLSALGLDYVPTEANFIFIDLGVDSRRFFEAMLRRGVIVRSGDIFGYDSFIRVTVGTEEENQRFLREVAAALAESGA